MATQFRNTQALMKRIYNQAAFFVFYLNITTLENFAVYEAATAFLSIKNLGYYSYYYYITNLWIAFFTHSDWRNT